MFQSDQFTESGRTVFSLCKGKRHLKADCIVDTITALIAAVVRFALAAINIAKRNYLSFSESFSGTVLVFGKKECQDNASMVMYLLGMLSSSLPLADDSAGHAY